MKRMAYVYHICRECDRWKLWEGYIGVSIKPSVRFNFHKKRNENPHLKNAFEKYDDIVIYALAYTTEKACYAMEERLRPERNMGWNINVGGSKPPNPKGTLNCISRLPKEKRRKNYTPTEETLEKLRIAQRKNSKFHSDRMLGELNPMYGKFGELNSNFKGVYVTPTACYFSLTAAEENEDLSKPAILRRCKKKEVIKYSRWYPKEWFGKLWSDLGWYFIDKEALDKMREKNKIELLLSHMEENNDV